ncbi:hypothetical protein G6F70_008551 [Rhizopus microsporus]|nr:hypothetical protein G6F71_002395 [Rhizopus microsporus]KAG1195028.1 hypothetical protein G6F70_008551 [Rhizopus microsporus]KAG1206860.1 hypothetical protein G6F69_008513 [Rhizopus microsporus]KAG1227441.1 hypothetical protein G6F67_008451 [Rhizopus microsporus]KAG1260577.1 hypothetical protein G6F68_007344 [Rhizopus microsporus]
MEGVRQLAVYSLATSKTTKTEARSMALKALKLHDSIKHLDEEPNDKSLALDKETVEKIYQARYEQSILRNAVRRSQNSFNQRTTNRRSPKALTNTNNENNAIIVFPQDDSTLHMATNGYQLQWNKTPRPWRYTSMKFTKVEQAAVDDAVKKFMSLEITEISPSQSKDYLSKFFTIQEPNKRCPVLDCTNLNQYIQLYRYKRLAFGLNVAPRVFSKLMRYASEPLREEENQICILPRRHMYIGEDKRRDADTCLTDDIPFTRIGISIQ